MFVHSCSCLDNVAGLFARPKPLDASLCGRLHGKTSDEHLVNLTHFPSFAPSLRHPAEKQLFDFYLHSTIEILRGYALPLSTLAVALVFSAEWVLSKILRWQRWMA